LPQSAIPQTDGLRGLVGLLAAWIVVLLAGASPTTGAALLVVGAALPMLAAEVSRVGPVRGDDMPRPWQHPAAWTLGFAVAMSPFLALFWSFWGGAYWLMACLVVAPAFTLRWVIEARRGYAWAGRALPLRLGLALLRWDHGALRRLGEPARQWAIKAFFVPLYGLGLSFCVWSVSEAWAAGAWLTAAVFFGWSIDAAFGLASYVFASDGLGAGTRSTQRAPLGWLVCLVCYPPFWFAWPEFAGVLLHENKWPTAVAGLPGWAAAAMLAVQALYVSATVAMGLRFANLSSRGLIAHGPYRLMKHPMYFGHVTFAWMTVLVVLPLGGVAPVPATLLAAAGITLAYRLRATTEEAHLSEDPEYRRYAEWIAEHGLLARIKRAVLIRPKVA